MPQEDKADSIEHLETSESPNADLSKFAELARQAYVQKRTKDCLDLTRSMLLIDPENADALQMRASIQLEMNQDLDYARAFLREVQHKENPEQQSQPDATATPPRLLLDPDEPVIIPDSQPLLPQRTFTLTTLTRSRWLVGATALVVVCIIAASLPRFRTNSNAAEALLVTPNTSDQPSPAVSENAPQPDRPVLTPTAVKESVHIQAPTPPPALATATPAPASVSVEAPAQTDAPVVAATGRLAISSPASVDIYENDTYLGSAPVSLDLSPGAHTLEYRHDSLRKKLTHVVNSNETTKTTITFDVSVQINSKPWAEVFVDGAVRKDLGQTPLSGVRVPIGSVLIFENPQFQAKRYRVTGNETGIQISFP